MQTLKQFHRQELTVRICCAGAGGHCCTVAGWGTAVRTGPPHGILGKGWDISVLSVGTNRCSPSLLAQVSVQHALHLDNLYGPPEVVQKVDVPDHNPSSRALNRMADTCATPQSLVRAIRPDTRSKHASANKTSAECPPTPGRPHAAAGRAARPRAPRHTCAAQCCPRQRPPRAAVARGRRRMQLSRAGGGVPRGGGAGRGQARGGRAGVPGRGRREEGAGEGPGQAATRAGQALRQP